MCGHNLIPPLSTIALKIMYIRVCRLIFLSNFSTSPSMYKFSAAKAAQEAQMSVRPSVRPSVREDTLTLTAYKSLCRCRTYKCEVSLEPYTQGLLI